MKMNDKYKYMNNFNSQTFQYKVVRQYCNWAYMITWNCAINLTSQCFVCKGIKNNWGWGYHSDPILICCGIAVLILRLMYKYQKLTIESLGSWAHIFFLNDAWKTQGNMNVIIETQGGGRIGEWSVYREEVSLHLL